MDNNLHQAAENQPGEDFAQRLVAKLDADQLAPRPRWQFLLKDYALWLSGISALLLGAAAFAVIIYLLQYSDWEMASQTEQGFSEYLLLTLPYFWLACLALFIFILNYNLRHTGRTYRYHWLLISSASVVASLFLGILLYAGGWGDKIDDVLGAKLPSYGQVINRHMIYWNQPQSGRLSGVVSRISPAGEVFLVAPDGSEWQVFATSGPLVEYEFQVGDPIRAVGRARSEGSFQIHIMKKVHPGRAFMRLRLERPGMGRPGWPASSPY